MNVFCDCLGGSLASPWACLCFGACTPLCSNGAPGDAQKRLKQMVFEVSGGSSWGHTSGLSEHKTRSHAAWRSFGVFAERSHAAWRSFCVLRKRSHALPATISATTIKCRNAPMLCWLLSQRRRSFPCSVALILRFCLSGSGRSHPVGLDLVCLGLGAS